MKLVFEKSVEGRALTLFPECDVPEAEIDALYSRKIAPKLPQLAEIDISRHYTELAKRAFGVNCGFYPLGSCTMKYNPRVDEDAAALAGFTGVHPLQGERTVQGCLEVLDEARRSLCEITGMDDMTFQPAAGAHGEFTGLLLIKAYHSARGDAKRNKIIVPDSAHGTNPASAAMAGMTIVNVPSGEDGCVDLQRLSAVLGYDTAGLMLTNPNTVGLFDRNILEITRLVHEAGGLCYYDGANLNAVMGVVRPGDMGFDVVHLNLHKTFATPHGGGGPGSGAVGCRSALAEFLPGRAVVREGDTLRFERPEHSIGGITAFYGNFLVVVKALTYIVSLGAEGIPEAARNAVLNANYLMALLRKKYRVAYDRTCMHEFVLTLEDEKKQNGVSAMSIAKTLLDFGIHPPTMYFPLMVHEALMVEPTETESKETLDDAARTFAEAYDRACADPTAAEHAPYSTPISRPDEVAAARNAVVRYEF